MSYLCNLTVPPLGANGSVFLQELFDRREQRENEDSALKILFYLTSPLQSRTVNVNCIGRFRFFRFLAHALVKINCRQRASRGRSPCTLKGRHSCKEVIRVC